MTPTAPAASRLSRRTVRRRRIAASAVVLVVLLGVAVAIVLNLDSTGDDGSRSAASTSSAPTTSLPANTSPAPVLAPAADDAPTPTVTGLAKSLAAALGSPALGRDTAMVLDAATGRPLLDKASTTAMTPGSTMKLYAALAAANVLEPGHRLTTSVVAGPAPGQIVLVGGGDPTLSTAPTSALYPGASTVAGLAAAVKAAGVSTVTKVIVDTDYFSGPTTAVGWGSGDAPSTYAAPVTSVMVDGGRTSTADKAVRSAEPALAAGRALAAALGAPQAQVVSGTAQPAAKSLGVVRSAPIEDLIEQAISTSDNVLIECIARQVAIAAKAPASFSGAVAAVQKEVGRLGVDLTGLVMHDASGLSGLDRTTAKSLASLLAVAASGDQPRSDVVLSALSVGGFNGTLATRFRGADARSGAGRVRAKTGTLTAVDSLAGTVLTKDGRLLVFALISNDGAGVQATRAALDQVAAALAQCGCR